MLQSAGLENETSQRGSIVSFPVGHHPKRASILSGMSILCVRDWPYSCFFPFGSCYHLRGARQAGRDDDSAHRKIGDWMILMRDLSVSTEPLAPQSFSFTWRWTQQHASTGDFHLCVVSWLPRSHRLFKSCLCV